MKLPDSKKATIASILTFGLLGLLTGTLLIALNTDFLLKIVFVVMGVVVIVSNMPGLFVSFMSMKTRMEIGLPSLILSMISVFIGILMIFWHTGVLMSVVGGYMIVLPLIQILISKDKLLRLKTELPKLIIGIVLLLIGPSQTLNVMFDIAGWIILILTAVYVIAMLIGQTTVSKHVSNTGSRIFVDTTGDGKIDTVYVDTTGDGKADTATPYRDDKE